MKNYLVLTSLALTTLAYADTPKDPKKIDIVDLVMKSIYEGATARVLPINAVYLEYMPSEKIEERCTYNHCDGAAGIDVYTTLKFNDPGSMLGRIKNVLFPVFEIESHISISGYSYPKTKQIIEDMQKNSRLSCEEKRSIYPDEYTRYTCKVFLSFNEVKKALAEIEKQKQA